MNIALKGLKVSASQSEETTAFVASITLDGKVVGEAKNSGRGESDHIWWKDREAGARIEAYAKTRPATRVGDLVLPSDIESLIQDLVDEALNEKQYKRWCKKGITFRVHTDAEGTWRTMTTHDRAKAVAYIEGKFPGQAYEILNDRFTPVSL